MSWPRYDALRTVAVIDAPSDKLPQGLGGFRRETVGIVQRGAIDLGFAASAAPDQVRLQSDDGVAAARFPALHAFQQKGIVACRAAAFEAQLEIGGDRRFHVRHQPRVKQLGAALAILGCKSIKRGFHAHVGCFPDRLTGRRR